MKRGFEVFLLLAVIAAAWGAASFHDLAYFLANGDWDQYSAFFEVQRRSIQVYGEFPHWNPWMLGGIPGSAHPQFNCLSPFFLPVLLFGTLPGSAVFFTLHVLVGLCGTYLLAREAGYERVLAVLGAVVFAFVFAPFVSDGVVNRVNGSLLPWLVWTFLRSGRDGRFVVAMAGVLAALILEGGFYALVAGVVTLGPLCFASWRPGDVLRAVSRCAVAYAAGCALAAARLLPTFDLYRQYPRFTEELAGRAIWNPEALADAPLAVSALLGAGFVGKRNELFGETMVVGCDVGLGVQALLLAALVFCWRRVFLWGWFVGLLMLTLGAASPLNLWAAMTRLPGLDSFNLPSSMIFAPFLGLALLTAGAARGWTRGTFVSPRARTLSAALLVAGVALAPLLSQQWHLLEDHGRAELPTAAGADEDFRQIRLAPSGKPQRKLMLGAVRQNKGVIDAYEEVVRERLEERRREGGDPGPIGANQTSYQGEVWIEDPAASVEEMHFSPNHRRVKVSCPTATTLVLNQNPEPGWRARLDGEELELGERGGRLSVALPAAEGEVELSYLPRTWWPGLGISLAFVVACAGILLTRPGRRALASLETPEVDASALLGPGSPSKDAAGRT